MAGDDTAVGKSPGATWSRDALAKLDAERRAALIASANADEIAWIEHHWPLWARPDQMPPDGDWRTWVVLGGRGAGKTRAGAEWLRAELDGGSPLGRGRRRRAGLIGASLADVREVMIEGPSGVRAVCPPDRRPHYEVSRRRLVWPNGAVAYAFSAEDPDSLRGPQFTSAWSDEFAAWREPGAVLTNLELALRQGTHPRHVVTTTPRPIKALRALMARKDTVVSRAATRDNAAWLSPAFLDAVERAYAGTRLGRQELDGELIDDVEGALWSWALVEESRDDSPPEFERVVIGVDPPASAGPASNACGIVVAGAAGSGRDRRAWVLADRTVQGVSPEAWAARVAEAARRYEADRVVVEVNQGGALVRTLLELADPAIPVREVRATRGKRVRAEPVQALYERGRVKHAGRFPALEDEMCAFGGVGVTGSPDRVDALVWAITDLLLSAIAAPRLRSL